MYLPEHFTENDSSEAEHLIKNFPLALLVAQTQGGLLANHIPLIYADSSRLAGHIALKNEMHHLLADGAEVLAVFTGEESYVSPNWYPSKAEHHRHVPTWNYQAVHIRGRIFFTHEEKDKRAVVGKLTRWQEQQMNGGRGWRMADAPADYIADMLAAIVAFHIEITEMTAKSKLSQNRDAQDFVAVRKELAARGKPMMAARMQRLGQQAKI